VAELLLVDDEPGIREGLAAVLRLRGHRVRCAATAGEALRSCHEPGLDLLLTDFKLPDGDGLTLAREFRAERPDLPVLLMTGHASPELRATFASLAHSRLVEKPVRPAEVARVIEELLAARPGRGAHRSRLDALPPEERVHVEARLAGACHDTCDRLSLAAFAVSLCGGQPQIALSDEGDLVRVEARWPANGQRPDLAAARWILALVGGDLQEDRDGLRVGFRRAAEPGTGTDLERLRPRTPDALAVATAGATPLRNAAPWLRLLCELFQGRALSAGRTGAPGLPPELATLWS
jgi:CheY-like chemotaxis protein